jgi:hypothetical protein
MSDTTTNLLLPYILAAQAQKHVTHNEALRLLDGLVQLSVLDRDLTAPPDSPADGGVDSGRGQDRITSPIVGAVAANHSLLLHTR